MRNATTMCLVCVFDGLRPDMVRPDWTPNLCRLRDSGVWFTQSHCVFPSVTRPNAAALASGSFAGTHGLAGNTVWRPDVEPERVLNTGEVSDLRRLHARSSPLLLAPTLGEVLAGAGLRTVTVGTGTSGCGYLQHPEAESTKGLVYHHAFTTPPELAERITAVLGPPPASDDYGALAVARVDYGARALTDVIIPAAQPALAMFWITVPDGLHHRYGLGSPEAVNAIQAADAAFGQMLDRLSGQGFGDNFDIIVTADHGYATVSSHIDIKAELVRAGLKQATDSKDVVLCADGGSCLVYADDSVDLEALSTHFMRQPWVAAVLSQGGMVPGTLSLEAVGCGGPHAPSLIVGLAWEDRPNRHGFSGTSVTPGGSPAGTGNHGGISPFEMRNMLLAVGPHFRPGLVSDAPCGIVDVAPTVLHCLGFSRPQAWDGRVLLEALKDGDHDPEAETVEETVAFAGGRQTLTVARAGRVSYTASARTLRE